MRLPWGGAKGTDSSPVRHGMDSPWRTWGNAQGFVEAWRTVLKARITFATCAVENELLDETRLQRLFNWLSSSLGRYPRLELT